ncbi:MAG: hypothetical protein WA988_17910 [Candidatus Nanopelagicales bacterium]
MCEEDLRRCARAGIFGLGETIDSELGEKFLDWDQRLAPHALIAGPPADVLEMVSALMRSERSSTLRVVVATASPEVVRGGVLDSAGLRVVLAGDGARRLYESVMSGDVDQIQVDFTPGGDVDGWAMLPAHGMVSFAAYDLPDPVIAVSYALG